MARGSRNNNGGGGASSSSGNRGRRGRNNDCNTPFSSSSFSNKRAKSAPRRPRPTNDGPRGLHDVYDFAQASTSASSKQARGARRALAGIKADDYSDLPSKAKAKQPKRRRNDDQDQEDDDEDSDDDSDAAPIGPKVFDSDDELNAGIQGSDEELDSDQAFGESDEEKFDGWTFGRGSKSINKRKRGDSDDEQDDDQDDEEQDDGEHGGMMHLSRMLDAPSGSDSDSSAEASDDENDQSSSKLAQHIQSYAAGSKRPTTTTTSDDQHNSDGEPTTKRSRRHLLSERTEAIPETEFAASQSGSTLRLEDFMSPLSSNIDFADVRKNTKLLSNPKSSTSSSSAPAASKKGGGALSAPLPSIIQDRLDRSGAYSITRDEVQGWQPTINRLRDAEHLSFPLQKPSVTKQSTSGLVATFNPDGDMESSIAAMLTEGGLTEKQLAEQEDLAMNKLDPQEARARRDELRRMRMLMFRAEQKAKRVGKIKSKAYRKIHRKEKERLKAQMKEFGSDHEGGIGQVDEEEEMNQRIKAERDRARERATLKHKNTSKWAKNILSSRHGDHNQEARNEIDAQLRRGAELRSKIQGRQLGQDSDSDSDSDSDDYSEGEEEGQGVVGDAFDELAALEAKEEAKRKKDEQEFEKVGGKKGVYNMKFMKDARERQYAAVRGQVDDFVTEMQHLEQQQDQEGSGSDSEDQGDPIIPKKDEEGGSSTYVQGNKGRALYGGTPSSSTTTTTAVVGKKETRKQTCSTPAKATVEIGGEATSTKPKPTKPSLSSFTPTTTAIDDDDAANPWLIIDSSGHTKLSRKKNDSTLSSSNSTSANSAAKSALKATKSASKSSSALAQRRADESIDINLSTNLGHQSPNDSDVDSDGDTIQPSNVVSHLTKKQRKQGGNGAMTALQQRDLVSSAFAGDDVVSEFLAEKATIVAQDESKTIDTRLPGWGSWTGKGIPHTSHPSKHIKTIKGVDVDKRKDAGMDRVIISERRDKKQDKFRVKDLPYPYTNVAQYKAAISQPLGKEWNTTIETQRLNLPRVMKKPGKVITPVVRKF